MDVYLQRVEGKATAPAIALYYTPVGDLPNQTKPNQSAFCGTDPAVPMNSRDDPGQHLD